MKAIVFDRFGEPRDVLAVREVPTPEPGPGEVLVRMIATPINPSDLLVVRGRYGVLPTLPATPGFEGVGVVEKAGSGLIGKMVVGKRVAAINSAGGNWAEYAVIPARQARPVPAGLADEQVASFFVNPMTVLAMVRRVLEVPKGAWLLQSAANSNLGRMVIRLAGADGIRTVNVVRRRESATELKGLGADAVVAAEEGPIVEQVRSAVGGEPIRYALDPVGGEIGSAVFRCLSPGGRLLVYGSLSEDPLRIESRSLIAGRTRIEGFWLGHFMRERSMLGALRLFHEIGGLIGSKVLATDVGPTFPLADIHKAVEEAEGPGRHGKVLLRTSG